MSEPSVLDYLLSILDPRRERIILEEREILPSEEELSDQFQESILAESDSAEQSATANQILVVEEKDDLPEMPTEPEIEREPVYTPFRWRIAFVVLFSLIGQTFLEPALRNLSLGLIFYGVAAGFLILSVIVGDWKFSDLPETDDSKHMADWGINWVAFAAGTIAMVVSFILFSGDLFNWGNFLFWVFAILCYMQAFSPVDMLAKSYAWVIGLFKKRIDFSKPLKIDWWTILIIFTTIVIVFFRFYQLPDVPGEMFSDHAEKLTDVSEVMGGRLSVYFPRNTGREAFQMYLTVLMAKLFGTGISFMSLKLGTAMAGLFTLPFIYLLGKEIANKQVGLIAYFFAGIAYWPNVIARVGLRFPLYPLFVAPVLFFLVRGLRQSRKWDFIWAGFFLGVGLHGYSPARMTPIVVVIAILIYILHKKSKEERIGSLYGLIVIIMISFIMFMPLLHYALWNMDMFAYRAMTRLGTVESEYPGNPIFIFLSNLFNALAMFFWDDGEIWVHSVPHRPALDLVSAAFYFIGSGYVLIRYIKKRNWVDLFILLSVPLLMMPSIMSLAFPGENPSLNRTGGAVIPVFILMAIGFDGLFRTAIDRARKAKRKPIMAYVLGLTLIGFSLAQNFDLVFTQYKDRFLIGAWNSSDMGEVINEFATTYGDFEHAYIVPFPYWVDTKIVGITSQHKIVDMALWPEDFEYTLDYAGPKLFLMKYDDYESQETLHEMYPQGSFWRYDDDIDNKDFIVLFVPPAEGYVILEQQTE
jgi:hypothetical protein